MFIQGFGLTPVQYALIFGANSFGLICCAQLNPLLLRRFGHSRVLRGVSRVHLAATAALTVIAFAGLHIAAAGHCAGVRGDKLHGHAEPQHHRGRAGTAAASRRQRVLGDGHGPVRAGRVQRPDGGAGSPTARRAAWLP